MHPQVIEWVILTNCRLNRLPHSSGGCGVVRCGEGGMYLSHWGVQLILAYSWARPAILVAGKGRGRMFLFLLFLHFHSCSSFFPLLLFHLLYCLFYLFSPFSGRRHKITHKGWRVVKPQQNQKRYAWLWDIDIPREKWLNYLKTVETLIILQPDLVCTVSNTFLGVSSLQWFKY